jgi:phosphate transport system permease protein
VSRFWKDGDPLVWATGGALAICLILVAGLLLIMGFNAAGAFWSGPVERFTLDDGSRLLGSMARREEIPGKPGRYRIQVKVGNRDLGGADFVWVDEARIRSRETPEDAVVLERREWGNFYGWVREVREGGKSVASGADAWKTLQERLPAAQALQDRIERLDRHEIGANNRAFEENRRARRRLELRGTTTGPAVERLDREAAELKAAYEGLTKRLAELRGGQTAKGILVTEDGKTKELELPMIVRMVRPNATGVLGKTGVYLSRLREFVLGDPRESNTEGGVFPALFGTVMMVLIMSAFVTPLGVLAALYLREYARQGPLVSAVRIAVNNLAGVPSIVFGVFGVGFFVYTIGGTVDRLFYPEVLPVPTFGTGGILWASLTLALLTVPVVIVSTEEGLAAIPKGLREASLALGATKWETTWRVVLPALAPSILTGLILAMARAAGEVAPLMITGVVKLAPTLPLDGEFPFFHPDRKFMHLGFHIFDVGFQSPNVDAARPMVFMTTLLLLAIIVALNLTAIVMRKRLRRKLMVSTI